MAVLMGAKKKKTILRTIRISEDIDAMLESDATEQNISANALISKIMIRYVEWDRVTAKTSYLIVPSPLFKALLNEISDEKLEEIGKSFATNVFKDLAMLKFGKADFDTLLKTLFLFSKYDTGLDANAPLSVDSKVDDKRILSLRHDLGPKGGLFLKGYLEALVKHEQERQATITVTDDVITICLPKSKPNL
jgi:hypothetical protein